MGSWTLDDIPWDRFDGSKVNPDLIPVVKAASMVEYNADDYRRYLQNVFVGDERLRRALDQWTIEEVQHGEALGKWASLADPEFDFQQSFDRFVRQFGFPLEVTESVRGSCSGELLARCMVETGTCSFYSALADATDEPVLKEICRRIADDEYAHYHLFRSYMRRYLQQEHLSLPVRLKIAYARIVEAEDDELASAYWAANRPGETFDRRSNWSAYAQVTLNCYRSTHVAGMVEMIFRALELDPSGPAGWAAVRAARVFMWYRARFCPRVVGLWSRLSFSRFPVPPVSQRFGRG